MQNAGIDPKEKITMLFRDSENTDAVELGFPLGSSKSGIKSPAYKEAVVFKFSNTGTSAEVKFKLSEIEVKAGE